MAEESFETIFSGREGGALREAGRRRGIYPRRGPMDRTSWAATSERPARLAKAAAERARFRIRSSTKDPALFRQVRVEGGTLVWPNGADACPDALYYEGTPPWAQARAKEVAP